MLADGDEPNITEVEQFRERARELFRAITFLGPVLEMGLWKCTALYFIDYGWRAPRNEWGNLPHPIRIQQ